MPNPRAAATTGARASGRVPVAFRATNDSTGILGDDVDIGEDYNVIVQETLDKEISPKTRKDYRNRLKRIIDYWKIECPAYYEKGVRKVPQDELIDVSKYHYGKTEDIIYSSTEGGINGKAVIRFLAHTRKKKGGNLKTHGELRKFKDAILWGAKMQDELLPSSFYTQVERYLNSFKKEVAVARRDGMVEDKAADPITIPLYHSFLERSWSFAFRTIDQSESHAGRVS